MIYRIAWKDLVTSESSFVGTEFSSNESANEYMYYESVKHDNRIYWMVISSGTASRKRKLSDVSDSD
jgi:hypothetical protein